MLKPGRPLGPALALLALSVAACHTLLDLNDVGYREQPSTSGAGGGLSISATVGVGTGGTGGGSGGAGGQGGTIELTGDVSWVASLGDALNQRVHDVTFVDDGAVVAVGVLDGSVSVAGAGHSNAAGAPDVLVVRYSSDGDEEWARSFGNDNTISATVEGVGSDVLLTGRYSGAGVNTGGGVLPGSAMDTQDIFFSKLDAEGDHKWSATMGSDGVDRAWSAAGQAGDGSAMLIGSYEMSVDFGSATLTSDALIDGFAGLITHTGPVAPVYGFTSSFHDIDRNLRPISIAQGPSGDCAILAHHSGTDLGEPGNLLVRKIDLLGGNPSWTAGDAVISGALTVGAVAVDSDEHTLVAATFTGDITTPGGQLSTGMEPSILMLRFDENGAPKKNLSYATVGGATVNCLSAAGGYVVMGGSFPNQITFGTRTLVSAGGVHGFVVKFDSAGDVVWSHDLGDAAAENSTIVTSCEMRGSGEVVLGGRVQGSALVGAERVTSEGDFDWFVAKLAP